MAVRVRKPQTPARSTQYLLNVDRTLRRISLKKLPVRVKKTATRVRSRQAKKSVARETKKPKGAVAPVVTAWPSSRAIAYALIGIVAVATLIGVPSLFQQSDSAIAAGEATTSASATTPPSARPFNTTKAAAKPVAMGAAATRIHTPDVSASSRASESTPNEEPKPHAEPLAGADVQNAAGHVTISGCLQRGDDSFWLKDTEGADAPKSRSWKSGFLKRQSASVQVVDATHTLNLSTHLGQRVTATGTLANRTMQARSLQRVAASCN
jgi:hypothetical protein